MTVAQFKQFLLLWFDADPNAHEVARDLGKDCGLASPTAVFHYATESGWWTRGYMTPGPLDRPVDRKY